MYCVIVQQVLFIHLSHSQGLHALLRWLALANGTWDLKQREVLDVPMKLGLFCGVSITLHEKTCPRWPLVEGGWEKCRPDRIQTLVWRQAQMPRCWRPHLQVKPSLDLLNLCAKNKSFCFTPVRFSNCFLSVKTNTCANIPHYNYHMHFSSELHHSH